MKQVRVLGIALDQNGQHLVLLKPIVEAGEPHVLPVWIGPQEANSILVAINDEPTPRPLTHELMTTLVDVLGARLERIEITRLDGGTFYAEITLITPSGPRVIDARPSDAIGLAVRATAPIWVADDVFEDASVPAAITGDSGDDGDGDSDDDGVDASVDTMPIDDPDEEKLEEFKRFLEEVDPEDFQG